MKRLLNKICLVTGAARGIGKAITELFHQEEKLKCKYQVQVQNATLTYV